MFWDGLLHVFAKMKSSTLHFFAKNSLPAVAFPRRRPRFAAGIRHYFLVLIVLDVLVIILVVVLERPLGTGGRDADEGPHQQHRRGRECHRRQRYSQRYLHGTCMCGSY